MSSLMQKNTTFRFWLPHLNDFVYSGSKFLLQLIEGMSPPIVQESTGIKDCNGVEIFEGDVLLNKRWKTANTTTIARPYHKVTWASTKYDPYPRWLTSIRTSARKPDEPDYIYHPDWKDMYIVGHINDGNDYSTWPEVNENND